MAGVRSFLFFIVMAAVWITNPCAPSDAASAEERPLTKREVTELYEGKSWLWSDGVGYFAPKGLFSAKAGSGKGHSTVKGDWIAQENGRLCFSGIWKARSGQQFNRTCFLHKTKDGNIYQKRLPNGEWYVFRHDPQKEGDQKLVAGDETENRAAK